MDVEGFSLCSCAVSLGDQIFDVFGIQEHAVHIQSMYVYKSVMYLSKWDDEETAPVVSRVKGCQNLTNYT